MDFQHFLLRANDVLTASMAAMTFALVLYFVFYNRRSRIAGALSGLLACVLLVYAMDLLLTNIPSPERAEMLLRAQWIGIAFTPAFYVVFVRLLQRSVSQSSFPKWVITASFILAAIFALLALGTDLIVNNVVAAASVYHMQSGPLFFPFAIIFVLTAVWGLRETLRARRRCYTRTAKRRMAYLSLGFVAPAIAVFPYLLLIGWPASVPGTALPILLILGNLDVVLMLSLMGYSVAFFDALTPDRVIKHRIVRFLLRGPLTALLALIAFGVGLTLEPIFGLGEYTLSLVFTASAIIISQLGIELAKPLIDLALYRDGAAEVAQTQELSQRLLTTSDLQLFLENVLAAMCELLRSSGGFLAILENGKLDWQVWCDLNMSPDEFDELPLNQVVERNADSKIISWDGYWVLPLHDKEGQALLGIAGVQSPEVVLPLTEDQQSRLDQLTLQASAALADRRLQQVVFQTFTPLLPELEDIQRRGGMLRYEGEATQGFSLVESPELPQWVHDALAHYWGGPRLTENPLLELQVVKKAAEEYDGNTVKGLRTVLSNAIEKLRPEGERNLTAPEWLLYNILEMKFLRGEKVRHVAMRLAVSESDFYRKQRVAIENLAKIVAEMEQDITHNGSAN